MGLSITGVSKVYSKDEWVLQESRSEEDEILALLTMDDIIKTPSTRNSDNVYFIPNKHDSVFNPDLYNTSIIKHYVQMLESEHSEEDYVHFSYGGWNRLTEWLKTLNIPELLPLTSYAEVEGCIDYKVAKVIYEGLLKIEQIVGTDYGVHEERVRCLIKVFKLGSDRGLIDYS